MYWMVCSRETVLSVLTRDGIVIFEGPLASLKRFKDDVKEVKQVMNVVLYLQNFNDIKEGDLEAFEMVERFHARS